MTDNNTETEITKRKPGRPRKLIDRIIPQPLGICEAPNVASNIIEFNYTNSKTLRTVFAIFKAYDTKTIDIEFTTSEMLLKGQGHSLSSNILIKIDCRYASYYCKEPYKFSVPLKDLHYIFQNIDETYYDITLFITENDKRLLHILAHESEYDAIDEYTTEVYPPTKTDYDAFDSDANYSIRFTMSGKQFKKRIVGNTGKDSNTLTVKKIGNKLELSYEKFNNTTHNCIFSDFGKINLSAQDEELFLASVSANLIKPFATMMFPVVNVAIDAQKKICTYGVISHKTDTSGAPLDTMVKVKIFNSIIITR